MVKLLGDKMAYGSKGKCISFFSWSFDSTLFPPRHFHPLNRISLFLATSFWNIEHIYSLFRSIYFWTPSCGLGQLQYRDVNGWLTRYLNNMWSKCVTTSKKWRFLPLSVESFKISFYLKWLKFSIIGHFYRKKMSWLTWSILV